MLGACPEIQAEMVAHGVAPGMRNADPARGYRASPAFRSACSASGTSDGSSTPMP